MSVSAQSYADKKYVSDHPGTVCAWVGFAGQRPPQVDRHLFSSRPPSFTQQLLCLILDAIYGHSNGAAQ